MKYLSLFLLLVLVFTGCSQHKVEVEKEAITEKPLPGIISESVIQKAENKYGKNVRKRYERFNTKIRELQNTTTEVKLEEINSFFNKIPHVKDVEIWDKSDYWATPLEFLAKAKGDCEDYVIAKYFSLINLGVESKKLYFAYVKSTQFTSPHMVLSYFEKPYSVPLVLDNINLKIFPADKRQDLVPVYNYNGDSLYRAKKKGQNAYKIENKKAIDDKWQRLLDDIEKNKL